MSAIKTFLLLLALFCAFNPSPLCEAVVCYVKPTETLNTTCPSEPCLTLDEYVSNSTRYFASNTVFMFLSGHHHISKDLIVYGVHNITLKLYKSESNVVISSKCETYCVSYVMMFEDSYDIAIQDMTHKNIKLRFEFCTNVTLTGLTAEDDAAIVLDNVLGEVSISHFKCRGKCYLTCSCIDFTWSSRFSQSLHIPSTVVLVLLHELDLLNSGVSISGYVPGKIVLSNSTFLFLESSRDMKVRYSTDLLSVCSNSPFCNDRIGLSIDNTVPTSQYYPELTTAIVLYNVSFIGCSNAILLGNVQNATICDCFFRKSYLGAVVAINSKLSLTGNVTFIDNHSEAGGAISLIENSQILILEPNDTYILFENNTADSVGGAIYVSSSNTFLYVTGYCKMYIRQISSKIVFNFSMNTAVNGGNDIYGAYLMESCYSPNGTFIESYENLIQSISHFQPKSLSTISSDAETLCFCDENEEPGFGTQLSVYPGQTFEISVAALGDMNGFVSWPVTATIYQGSLCSELQHTQNTNAKKCTNLQYSILSKEASATIELALTPHIIGYAPSCKEVQLLECPLGFALSSKYGCECNECLLQNIESIICNITEQSIQRQNTTWIGILKNSSGILIFSAVCPFHYCNESSMKIHVNQYYLNEDIQCTDDRSGVLCGGCRDNFSLALGSNKCLHSCSSKSLSLIIAFAAAGIALVFFIKILNLTVSQGAINGLIFFANIVGAEQTVLLSSGEYGIFLSVFIAWVNLDLGIETCFFNGMDAYAKAWLQFVFPAYVWAIALVIIILSRYSLNVSKLFGNNSVPVLATLILLSYSKLLRTIISALSLREIQFLNGSTMSVWERDGNIQYLIGKHIPLFVFAVLIFILLWIPFTLALVSIQWLQRGTHYRVLCWVTKLMPFFDAFTGPFKDKHRYWVGALLLARCSLLLIFYIYTANGSGVALVSIIFAALIILVLLAVTGFVYKNHYLAVLEASYILNLGILATGTLYVRYINNSGSQEVITNISIGVAFLQFIATVIYHICMQLKESLRKLKLKMGVGKDTDEPEHDEYESLAEPLQQPPFQEESNFREPLLGYI